MRNFLVKLTSNEIVQPHVQGQFKQYKLFPMIYMLSQYNVHMRNNSMAPTLITINMEYVFKYMHYTYIQHAAVH